MNILVLTGVLHPQPGNNANLICKLLPHLAKDHTVHLAAPAPDGDRPDAFAGTPVHWIEDPRDLYRKLIVPAVGKLTDPNGYSDAVQALVLNRGLRAIRREYPFDCILTTMEPFPSACAALNLPKTVKKVLYLMDPPACTCGQPTTPYRTQMLPKVLMGQDLILTTPFIREALEKQGFRANYREVGFPMLEPHDRIPTGQEIPMPSDKINLLFCGWLYSDIRSPRYFLDIARHLDQRFRIIFMGKECETLRERFDFDTGAEVVTLTNQPYQVALNAMADADILINIGNSVPVHMPSKTLEYINTGKPIINFHKLPDCPTLHYTSRYPLCLNLLETGQPDMQTVTQFIRFCTESRGRTAPTVNIPDCTPEHIARIILDEIGA